MDDDIKILKDNEIFVFGSNEKGYHGAGAAKYALDYFGAKFNQATGLQGQSYAIPTKNKEINTLPVEKIRKYVNEFINFATTHPEYVFLVTPIGCGLAGYKPADIAPLFEIVPENVKLPEVFKTVLNSKIK